MTTTIEQEQSKIIDRVEARVKDIRLRYHLPYAPALLLHLLINAPSASVSELVGWGVAPSEASARSVVSKLRKFLKEKNIEVNAQYGLGYSLDDEAKRILLKEIYPGG